MRLHVRERSGVCRWCGCTEYEPCEPPCGWANRPQTLCTSCATFDSLMQRAAGRAEAVALFNLAREESRHEHARSHSPDRPRRQRRAS